MVATEAGCPGDLPGRAARASLNDSMWWRETSATHRQSGSVSRRWPANTRRARSAASDGARTGRNSQLGQVVLHRRGHLFGPGGDLFPPPRHADVSWR